MSLKPHDPLIRECPWHGTVLEPRDGYEWCPDCRGAWWCACETCETFRALERL